MPYSRINISVHYKFAGTLMFEISAREIDNYALTSLYPMFFGNSCYQNTLEKLYLTNVHMKQNSRSVSPLSIVVPKSKLTIELMICCITRWSEVVKGRKNNDQREVIQCYLMTSSRQILRVSPDS